MKQHRLERHSIRFGIVLACAGALTLASFAHPGAPSAAPAKTAAAAADTAKTKPAAKTSRADRRRTAHEAHEAAHAKKRDARLKEDQDDTSARHPWMRGADWFALRVGTAAASQRGRPTPGPGFGFGYQHFISRRWALGLQIDYDLLGKYAGAAEMEVPMHAEITRHYDWGEAMRPYLGISAGGTWHRTYRTGGDEANLRPSLFFVSGGNAPVGPRTMMGADFRIGWENDARSLDPVFPNGSNSLLTWRAKVSYLRW